VLAQTFADPLIVPGVAGGAGSALITTFSDASDVHPCETVKV